MVDKVQFNIDWDLEHFFRDYYLKQSIRSPVFTNADSGNQWQLIIKPKNVDLDDDDENRNIGLFLVLHSSPHDTVTARFSIKILHPNGSLFKKKHSFNIFSQNGNNCGWDEFITFDEFVDGGTFDESLLIRCCILEAIDKGYLAFGLDLNMKDQFQQMYSSQTFCDVSLIVGDKTIMAHKVILSAASPVFRTIFENATNEERSKLVIIEDFNYEVIKALIDIIYGNQFDYSLMEEVLIAANKYRLNAIKDGCISKLIANLNSANAGNYIVYANAHDAEELEIAAAKFVLTKKKKKILTEI